MKEAIVRQENMLDKNFVQEIMSGTIGKKILKCIQCGTCSGACPISSYMEFTPRRIVNFIREGFKNEVIKVAYDCLTCGQCGLYCPSGIETKELWHTIREIAYNLGQAPEEMMFAGEIIADLHNVWGGLPQNRTDWLKQTGLEKEAFKDEADVVYFASCTASYQEVSQGIARSSAELLTKLNEKWTLLDEEWCCGTPLIYIGDREKAGEFARHNLEEFEKKKVKLVITSCPTCYRTLKVEYPRLLHIKPSFEVMHMTEYISTQLRKGNIRITEKIPKTVTFHDPCDLSRESGIIEEPREILRVVTDKFIEMPLHGTDTMCCGGGGLLQAVDEDLSSWTGVQRIKQAEMIGAEVLTSACGACKKYLSEAAEKVNSNIEIKDITEILIPFVRTD
ncbi:MAG: (Fe-S)-binding protein [Promethearchaeota archaeon]